MQIENGPDQNNCHVFRYFYGAIKYNVYHWQMAKQGYIDRYTFWTCCKCSINNGGGGDGHINVNGSGSDLRRVIGHLQ